VKRSYLLIVPVVIVGLVVGVKYAARKKPVALVVREAEIGTVESTVSNTRAGSVKARHRALLAPAIGGQIATLNVQKGDQVRKGEILLTLWNKDLKADVELARSQLAVDRANARQTCVLADNARNQARRQTQLRQYKATSDSDYEDTTATAEAKVAACEAARAQIEVDQGRLDAARAMLERSQLTAPFDGVVAEVNGEVGEYVTPSPPGIPTLPAIDLINMDSLYIATPIDEIDAARIRPGMEARITLDAYPKRVFSGRVRSISPYVLEQAKQARTVEIEADFIDPGEESGLLVGYSADVEVVIDSRKDVLKVPTESVLEGGFVYVLHAGRVQRRTVTAGISNWRFTQVVSGLEKGEQVVVTVDREGLADGAKATIDTTVQEAKKK
jgi:HlyD family secretion protein